MHPLEINITRPFNPHCFSEPDNSDGLSVSSVSFYPLFFALFLSSTSPTHAHTTHAHTTHAHTTHAHTTHAHTTHAHTTHAQTTRPQKSSKHSKANQRSQQRASNERATTDEGFDDRQPEKLRTNAKNQPETLSQSTIQPHPKTD
jgi:hypothetical protein